MTHHPNNALPVKRRAAYIAIASVMVIVTALWFLAAVSLGSSLNEVLYLRLTVSVLGMVFALTLYLGCCFSIQEDMPQGRALAGATVVIYISILLSGVFDILSGMAEMRWTLLTLQNLTSILSVLIHLLIWKYQYSSLPKNRMSRCYNAVICGILLSYVPLLTVNLFAGFLFYVDAAGNVHYPGEVIEITLGVALYSIYLLYVLRQRCPLHKKLSVASFAVFPLLYCAFAAAWYISGMTYSVLSTWYIFLLLAAYVVFFGDYIESRELLLRQKAELAEKEQKQTELQTSLMLSQIRPHFLFNALTAIQDLCQRDPKEADRSLGLFAEYLRGNMDALGSGRIIPFSKELEHIKAYLTLEQLRFGDELKVEYDIRFQSFSLPALTVQPIVENAVRHGATMNENGGTVSIRTEESDSGAVITVTDNGPGFDPEADLPDGRTHYGLNNVRVCLASTGCGEMRISSAPGRGTTVTLYIREDKGE